MKSNKSDTRDFHLHSIYSDGLFTPTGLLDEAARLNVPQIAITDHNTVAGLPEALHVSQQSDLQLITGIEVTAHFHGKEIAPGNHLAFLDIDIMPVKKSGNFGDNAGTIDADDGDQMVFRSG